METKPVLALTMGDPSGIGPEITLKALLHSEVYEKCILVVIGDKDSLEMTAKMLDLKASLHPLDKVGDASGQFGTIDYLNLKKLHLGNWKLGEVSAVSGEAAFSYVE